MTPEPRAEQDTAVSVEPSTLAGICGAVWSGQPVPRGSVDLSGGCPALAAQYRQRSVLGTRFEIDAWLSFPFHIFLFNSFIDV